MHVLWPPSAVLADVLDSEFCRGKLWAKIEFAFWGVCLPSLGARSQERAPSGAAALGSGRTRERTPSGADALGGGRCKIKENRKKFSSRYARQQLKIVKKNAFRATREKNYARDPSRRFSGNSRRGALAAAARAQASTNNSKNFRFALRAKMVMSLRSRHFSNCSRRGRWQRSGSTPGGVPQVRRDANHRRSGLTGQSNALLIYIT